MARLFPTAPAAGAATAPTARPIRGRRLQITSTRDRIVSATRTSSGGRLGSGADAIRGAVVVAGDTSMSRTLSLPEPPSARNRLSRCSAAARGCSVTAAFRSASAPSAAIALPPARMIVSPGSMACFQTAGRRSGSLPSDAARRVVVRCTKSASSLESSPGRNSRARRTRKIWA